MKFLWGGNMIEVTKDIIGKKVVFTNSSLHKEYPNFYPKCGTVGVVVAYISLFCSSVYVQWTKGTTSGSDLWACDKEHLEFYKRLHIKCI